MLACIKGLDDEKKKEEELYCIDNIEENIYHKKGLVNIPSLFFLMLLVS